MAESFKYFVLPNNNVGGATIPITQAILPLASLTIDAAPNLLIALRSLVGWQAVSGGRTSVIFKIWRGAPVTGALIYSVEESAESGFDRNRVTSFSHVDSGFTSSQRVTYTLTVETPDAGRVVNIVGPLTFSAFSSIIS